MSESSGIALAQKILGARELPGESDPETPGYEQVDEDPFGPPTAPQRVPEPSSYRPSRHSYTSVEYDRWFMNEAQKRLAKIEAEETAEKAAAEEARRAAVAKAEPAVITNDIHGFDKGTEAFFLSNFAPSPVYINFHGVVIMLPTGEHVFQAMKAAAMLDRSPQAQIAYVVAMSKAPTPGKAKYLGRSVRIDPKRWDSMAINCMKRTVELKFSQNPELRKSLLATGKVKLVEENNWGDKLWGTVNGEGRNELGKILMSYRDSIKRY